MFFRRKKGKGNHAGIDPNGWMMSYADMVTILLAMFIVLSTLAKDQTGLSLYRGTGSYKKAINSLGVPGLMKYAYKSVELSEAAPRYTIENLDPKSKPAEPHQLADGELEQFQAFLFDLSQSNEVKRKEREQARAAVDIHSRINNQPPYLKEKQTSQLISVISLVREANYRAEIIVWAPTPADSMLARSVKIAEQIRQELLEEISLPEEYRDRVIAVSQPWRFKDIKRPVFSVVISRVNPQ